MWKCASICRNKFNSTSIFGGNLACTTSKHLKKAYRTGKLGKNLFVSYATKIDNQALRREYAQKKYQELENKLREAKQEY